jgi:hypothetical protein
VRRMTGRWIKWPGGPRRATHYFRPMMP